METDLHIDETATDPAVGAPAKQAGAMKAVWRKVRKPLADSRFVKQAVAGVLAYALRFVYWTNPPREGSTDVDALELEHAPSIAAIWHGQHLLVPLAVPRRRKAVVMVSRSADAELNALVIEKLGLGTVRGSGGRATANHFDKGGAKALIALKKSLDAGMNVGMIADIPHGTPREAGTGIVLLAKLSGRPLMPFAVATSRRRVLEKSWDKTTINLPFGHRGVVVGDPIHVPSNATEEVIEAKRVELTEALNAATARAYRLTDGTA